jgi:Metallo-peptidase family M12B Reprolysin-like
MRSGAPTRSRPAVLLVGRFMGTVLAHECGHALGLTHTKNDAQQQILTGALMDGDNFHTFRSYTDVAGYDAATGIAELVPPSVFRQLF